MATLAIPLIMSGISALGGLFANRKKETTSDTTQKTDMTNTNMPVYDPKTQTFRDMLINYYLDNLQSNDNVFDGYQREGLANINAGSQSLSRQIANIIAQRGIRGDAGSWASLAPQLARQGQISSFLNSIPLMKDQRRQSILGSTANFLSSLPVGNRGTQVGTQTSHTVGTQPGNMLGGALASGATTLAGLWGAGAFSKPQTTTAMPQLPMANRSPNLSNLFSLPQSYNPYASNPYNDDWQQGGN